MSKVLIVEDDRELAQLMSRAFESDGIAAVIAGSAEEAVLSAGPFEVDRRAKTIRKDGQLIALSPREFQLASVLRQHRGQFYVFRIGAPFHSSHHQQRKGMLASQAEIMPA